jgi:hypothetical protein
MTTPEQQLEAAKILLNSAVEILADRLGEEEESSQLIAKIDDFLGND